MTRSGPKDKPPHLRVVKGTHRKSRHGEKPLESELTTNTEGLEPPKKLRGRLKTIWDKFVRDVPWLTEMDTPSAYVWVHLYYECETFPDRMIASKIAQFRALNSELGLNYHVAGKNKKPEKGKNDDHFDD